MKKIKPIFLLITIIIFSSCHFNQSVNKDLKTGAYSRGDGIGCDEIVIEINGEEDNRNEFIFGEKATFLFNDITGLTNSSGKVYPGLSMHIVKNEKDTILSNPNLLQNLSEGTDISTLQLQAKFTTVLPHQNNEKYKLYVKIWDKKGDGKFNYELPFTTKKNDLLDVKSNGIEYSNIYLWNNKLKQFVFENNLNSEHSFNLVLNGIEGFELMNDRVFMTFSMEIIDSKGNKVFSEPNLFYPYEKEGMSPKDVKISLTTPEITFGVGKINNPLRLNAKVKDKYSSKEINISTIINVN